MPLPQLTPKSSRHALFLALSLTTLCSAGCQHTGERPSPQGALLEVRSGASVVSPQDTQALLRALLHEAPSVDLLQRALLGQALREQGYGAQLNEGSEGAPTWAQLLEVATKLSPEPNEEELKGRFERAYPKGLKLLGRQLMWRPPHLQRQKGRGALYDALLMWAAGALKEARRAVLRGAPLERVASEHALSLLEGEALTSHLSSLHDPSLISSLKRLRAGELSPTLTSVWGSCFYVRSANAQTLAHTLKAKLPRAVTLTEPLSQRAQGALDELNGLHRLCVETSREALSGATGRAFDASMRRELKALAELGALHQGSARAFGVTLQDLTPGEWPVALTTEALKRAQALKTTPQTPASRFSWLQFEAPDGLWLVEVRGAVEVSFEEVRDTLKAQRARERLSSGEARLNLEQLWEELSPQLKVRGAGSGSSQDERAGWGSLPTLMLPSK